MWIFTSTSFLSIVADKDQPSGPRLLVRARDEDAIEELFPKAAVRKTPDGDYLYRAWVQRNEVSRVVQNYINSLMYNNFKNSIENDDYHHACSGTWGVMKRYQDMMDAPPAPFASDVPLHENEHYDDGLFRNQHRIQTP